VARPEATTPAGPGRAAQQAAQALRPLTGPLAGLLFAAGILGTGLLAVLP